MKYLILIAILLIATPIVLGEQVIINSQDWRDVYSGTQYAVMQGLETHFVVNQEQGARLFQTLSNEDVLLITGREQAMPNFRNLLQAAGYEIEDIQSRDAIFTNQELAVRANTKNVVIVDDAYGYNALAVATYAHAMNSSVVFADIGVLDVIEAKNPEEVLLYGQTSSTLTEELEVVVTRTINNQDRFEDNFALVQRFQEVSPSETIIMSNGEFIEFQLMSDDDPVLFTGRENVPDQVIEFIQEQDFRIGVLVGNALAPNAKYIKDETGLSMFIKFAQGRNEQQYALDLFPLPIPNPLVQLTLVEFDPQSQQLFATFTNAGDVPVYVVAAFQTPQGTVEDQQPIFIDAGAYKTVAYDVSQIGDSVEYTLLYGAYPTALELIVSGSIDINSVEISDESSIAITGAVYSEREEGILVSVENIGPVDAYVLIEAEDVRNGLDRLRIGSEVVRIKQGDTQELFLPVTLTERDMSRNQELNLVAYFGAREFSLTKQERTTLAFSLAKGSFPWLWIVIAAVLALLLAFGVNKRRRPKPRW